MSLASIANSIRVNFNQISTPTQNSQNVQTQNISGVYKADTFNFSSTPPIKQPLPEQPPIEKPSIFDNGNLRLAGLAIGSAVAFGAVGAGIGAAFGSVGMGMAIGAGIGVLATVGMLIYAIKSFT